MPSALCITIDKGCTDCNSLYEQEHHSSHQKAAIIGNQPDVAHMPSTDSHRLATMCQLQTPMPGTLNRVEFGTSLAGLSLHATVKAKHPAIVSSNNNRLVCTTNKLPHTTPYQSGWSRYKTHIHAIHSEPSSRVNSHQPVQSRTATTTTINHPAINVKVANLWCKGGLQNSQMAGDVKSEAHRITTAHKSESMEYTNSGKVNQQLVTKDCFKH